MLPNYVERQCRAMTAAQNIRKGIGTKPGMLMLSAILQLAISTNASAGNAGPSAVTALLKDGEQARTEKKFLHAYASCRTDLTRLGDAYASTDTVDDSGLRLVVADDMLRKGEAKDAARMVCRILKGRLEMFRTK